MSMVWTWLRPTTSVENVTDTLHFTPAAPYDWAKSAIDQMVGPDLHGRHLAIKSCAYDADTGVATAELRAILPAEYRERIEPLVAAQRERQRIRGVFGG